MTKMAKRMKLKSCVEHPRRDREPSRVMGCQWSRKKRQVNIRTTLLLQVRGITCLMMWILKPFPTTNTCRHHHPMAILSQVLETMAYMAKAAAVVEETLTSVMVDHPSPIVSYMNITPIPISNSRSLLVYPWQF